MQRRFWIAASIILGLAARPAAADEIPVSETPTVAKKADEGPDPTVRPLQYWKEQFTSPFCSYDWFWKHIQIDGYLDQTFTYNFNRPDSRINTLRVFDRKDRAYLLNLLQLYIRKDPTEDSRWGFATRFNTGWDANVVAPYDSNNADKFDITEAYVSYLFPTAVGKGLLVKAGRFATLAGAEVIEQKDNMNISRSFLFGYAIPFTHTGVRAAWTLSDKTTLTFGVNRGWEIARRDNNNGLTYEAALNRTVNDKLSVAAVAYLGAEQFKNHTNQRRLLDLVATYKFTDKLTGVLNADIASEQGAAQDGSTAKWRGVAGYLKYDFTEKFSLAGRGEVFSDKDGARTGTDQKLWEATLTAQYKFRENLWGRLEARHDESDRAFFEKGDGFSAGQNTIAASILLTF